MKSKKKYNDYCTGCGLCKSEYECNLKMEKGFIVSDLNNVKINELDNICPYSSDLSKYFKDSIWGNYENIYAGWSNDRSIRSKASSGGILTSLAIFLLEEKKVDAIIQVKADNKNPLKVNTILSENKESILDCMGSRYCNSSPLENIKEIYESNKKYAFIGRPCDVLALNNYINKYKKYENIIYKFAFFCAGTPSDFSNKKLIEECGCDFDKCKSINYRGNGWPGFTTIIDKNEKEYKLEYSKSWGKYLGRDIRLMCKFCIDGIGVAADISCGDYWYLENDNPKFEEADGRNIIITRTLKGNKLIEEAVNKGFIQISEFENNDFSRMKIIQPAQYTRITTILDKYIAFKLFLRNTPKYNILFLFKLGKNNKLKNHFKIFIGTIKRIVKKRI